MKKQLKSVINVERLLRIKFVELSYIPIRKMIRYFYEIFLLTEIR